MKTIILMTSEVATAVDSAFCSGIFFCRYIVHERYLYHALSVSTYRIAAKMAYERTRSLLAANLEIMIAERKNPGKVCRRCC